MICFNLPEKGVGFCGQSSTEFVTHSLFPVEISSSLFWVRIFFGFTFLFVFIWKARRSLADAIVGVWIFFLFFGVSSWMSSLALINSLFFSRLPFFLKLLVSFSAGVLLPFQALFSLFLAWVSRWPGNKMLVLAFLVCLVGSVLSSEQVKVVQSLSDGIVRELRLDKSYFGFVKIVDLRYLIRKPVFVLGFISLLLVQDWRKVREQSIYLLSLTILTLCLAAKSFIAIPVGYFILFLIAWNKSDSLEKKLAKAIGVMFFLERIFNIDSVTNLYLPLSAIARLFGTLSICHLLVILILLSLKLGNRFGLYIGALALSLLVDKPLFS